METFLSEKGELAKKRLGNTVLHKRWGITVAFRKERFT